MVRRTMLEKDYQYDCEDCKDAKCDEELRIQMQCKCGRKILRNWLEKQIEEYLPKKKLYFWTVFLDRDEFLIGELHKFNVINSKRSISRYIKRIDIADFRAIGFLDIQFQEYLGYSEPRLAKWLCHYHFLVLSDHDINSLRAKLRDAFPKNSSGFRPSDIKTANKLPFNYGYLIKFDFEMKKKVKCFEGKDRPSHFQIKGKARRELRAFLSALPLLKSIYLIGFRRVYDRVIEI